MSGEEISGERTNGTEPTAGAGRRPAGAGEGAAGEGAAGEGGPPPWVRRARAAPPRPQSAHGKQFVKFSFFRLRKKVRSRGRKRRQRYGAELGRLLGQSQERMLTRVYSTIGTRRDTDFLVWQVADDLRPIMEWQAELLDGPLGGALKRSHSFLSMTMRSQYRNQYTPGAEQRDRFRADGGVNDWLFVYPMAKSKDWYQSSATRRNKAMAEHIGIGHAYPEIKINTTYSYGLDDQEFVVAFEGDSPGQFLALVRDLRVSDSTSFTEFDTPMFTCRRMAMLELLDEIGLGQGAGARHRDRATTAAETGAVTIPALTASDS